MVISLTILKFNTGNIAISATVQRKRKGLTRKASTITSCQFLGVCLSYDMSFREGKFARQGEEQNFLPAGLVTVCTKIAWVQTF